MFPLTFLSFFALLTGDPGPVVRRVVIQDTVVFRIPVRPAPPMQFEWAESKGPKCVATGSIVGAARQPDGEIDFILSHRRRVRAQFDHDCPAMDFYSGFYVEPEDEQLCAKRDQIRSRMGGSCKIRRFRKLTPQLRR